MRCPACQFDNPAGAKFCLECGARQATVACRHCGTELPATARFCMACGRPVTAEATPPIEPAAAGGPTAEPPPPARLASPESYTPRHLVEKILTSRAALEGERKLVTVLFCDLTGSTALAERLGAEAMHGLLSRFFDLALGEVHRHEGTINQFLGDGFMALFGAPVAHEDHARRAVLAAWAIQRRLVEARPDGDEAAVVRLQVRMGINTGHVVVGKIGDNLRMDYTAIGDATNLAARLEQLAEPGTILLSEATSRLVQGDVVLEPLEPVRVKGKAEPVTLYRLTGLALGGAVLALAGGSRTLPLVGRQPEMAALGDLVRAVPGGRGHVAELVGEAGIGKSRLLVELGRSFADAESAFLAGRCLSHGAGTPYLPVIDLVRAACGILEGDPDETATAKVRAALAGAGIPEAEAAPVLLRLVGVAAGTESLETLSPEAVKRRTFEAVQRLWRGGDRGRPRVLVVEDLQWIDEASEALLASLVERLPDVPMLLVVSYRFEYRPPWRAATPHHPDRYTQIVLGPLSPTDSLHLVHAVLRPAHVPDAVVADIIRKAEGNPLFLEELTRAVLEQGERGSVVEAPDTIQAVLLARVDRLADGPKQLLQTAAVLGVEFPRWLLAAVWDGPGAPRSVDRALEVLVRLDFLVTGPGGDEPTYGFRHGLTQEVAYAMLLTPRRQALHAAAARALEARAADGRDDLDERLAYHYARTELADKAVLYLSRVAERAAGLQAHEVAVRALEEALVHVARLPVEGRERRRLELVLGQAFSLYYLGQSPRILALLLAHETSLDRLADALLAGRYYFLLGRTYSLLGDQPRAAQAARRALAAATESGDLATAGHGSFILAFEAYCVGEPRRGLDHARRAEALLEASGDRASLGMAHWVAAINHLQLGDFAASLAAAARVRDVGVKLDDTRLQSYAGWTEGIAHATRGEGRAGVAAARAALESARDPFNAALARGFLGYAHLEDDPARAIGLLEPAVRQMGEFRFPQNEGLFTVFLSRAYLLSGNLERARELAVRALEVTRAVGFGYGLGLAQRVLGQFAQRRGALGDAKAHLTDALATLERIEARFEQGRTHLALAELAHTQWDPATRAAHLREAHALFRATGAPRYVERVERRAAEVGLALERAAA